MALTDPTGGRRTGLRVRRNRGGNGTHSVRTVVHGGTDEKPGTVELAEVDGTVVRVPAVDGVRSAPAVVPTPDQQVSAPTASDAPSNAEPGAEPTRFDLSEDCENTIEFSIRQFQAPDITAVADVTAAPADATGRPARIRGAHRTWSDRYARNLFLTDLLCLVWAAVGVHVIAPPIPTRISVEPAHLPFLAATALLVVGWLLALDWSGSRDRTVTGHGPTEYKRIIQATFAVFGVVAIASYLFKLDLPRSYLLIMMLRPVWWRLLASRFVWRRWLHPPARRGCDTCPTSLAVGDIHTVTELLRDLRRAPRAGYKVIGVCVSQDPRPTHSEPLQSIDGVPVLGGARRCRRDRPSTSGADTVAVTATAAFGPSAVRKLSWELEDTDAELILAPALTNIAGPRIHTQPVAGLPLIHVDRPDLPRREPDPEEVLRRRRQPAAGAAVLAGAARRSRSRSS